MFRLFQTYFQGEIWIDNKELRFKQPSTFRDAPLNTFARWIQSFQAIGNSVSVEPFFTHKTFMKNSSLRNAETG